MTPDGLESDAVIDGFIVGELLHSGGMASLWSVTKPGIDVPLLMKVPKLLDVDDPTVIVGFEMEMMILPRLSGAHVPRCFAVGDYARQPYVVMERIQGHSLLERLEAAPLPPAEVADIGAGIAEALIDVHRQNVLHLDIKPSNVMIRSNKKTALIDFGLSRHLLLPDLLEEEFEVPIGTGPYISPEQLYKIRTDPRSDLFSLGVLLYHFATKVRPFGYPRSQQGLRTRLWRDPVPPRSIVPDIPEWLQEIILHCLEVNPDERYPTAAQLLFDLKHPDEVALTQRAKKLRRDSFLVLARRWLASGDGEASSRRPPSGVVALAPIVMAAIDLEDDSSASSELLRAHIARVLVTAPGARLACVSVLRQSRLTINYSLDEQGRSLHVQRLVEVKEWARPLRLPPERVTFHVLSHPDPAQALIDYARMNHVDQILIGARGVTGLRRFLGGVSARVVAEAPCTVTVVRLPQTSDGAADNPEPEQTLGGPLADVRTLS